MSTLTQKRAAHRADMQAIVDATEYLGSQYKEIYGKRVEQLLQYMEETGDAETFIPDRSRKAPAKKLLLPEELFMATEIYNFFELTTSFDLKPKDTTRSHALRVSKNSLQPGNELTPVIPGFILVIPAKAGIHTDSPPEPYCPVPPLALSSPRRQRSTVGPGFPPSRE